MVLPSSPASNSINFPFTSRSSASNFRGSPSPRTPYNSRLRSPRGRKVNGRSLTERLSLCAVRRIALCMACLFPVVWMALHSITFFEVGEHNRLSSMNTNSSAPVFVSTTAATKASTSRVRSRDDSMTEDGGTAGSPPSSSLRLDPFDPAGNPVVPLSVYEPKSSNPLHVLYIGGIVPEPVEAKNTTNTSTVAAVAPYDVLLEALQRSRYIAVCATFLYQSSNHELQQTQYRTLHSTTSASAVPTLLVVDWQALQRDCHVLQRIVAHLYTHDPDLSQHGTILLWDTSASATVVDCAAQQQAQLLPPNTRIRVAKRSIVQGRRWNRTRGWIDAGERISQQSTLDHHHAPPAAVLHLPGYVTEEVVDVVAAFATNSDELPRSENVAHYHKSATSNTELQYYYQQLRLRIRDALAEASGTYLAAKGSYSTGRWVEDVGLLVDSRSSEDEDNATEILTMALLATSKIVVVAASDEWEDHDNRLMEALASGSMVLADEMVAPVAGLKNRTNIVFYDSADSLQRLVLYYLKNDEKREKIARHGQQFALGRHRTWHVVESVLFGKALTNTDKEPLTLEAPEVRAHSKEERATVRL